MKGYGGAIFGPRRQRDRNGGEIRRRLPLAFRFFVPPRFEDPLFHRDSVTACVRQRFGPGRFCDPKLFGLCLLLFIGFVIPLAEVGEVARRVPCRLGWWPGLIVFSRIGRRQCLRGKVGTGSWGRVSYFMDPAPSF